MSHKVLLIAVLCPSLVAFGQTGARNINPAQPQPVAVGNGLGWTAGTVGYYGEGPAGGVLLNTPTASFDSPLAASTAGISMAGRAGISDSNPVNTNVQSSLASSSMVYSNLPPEVPATEAPATEEVPALESPATAAVSPTARVNDYGPSFFSNETGGKAMNGASLAEIAEKYRDAQATLSVRTYTNRDIRPPATVGDTENILLARNAPPQSPQSASSGTQAPRPSASSAGTATQAVASAEQPGQSGNQSEQLPASSSILPLLGLLGMMSAGLGLCLRALGRRKIA